MDELGRMFGIYGAGPRLPWLWIIEYVSSFPQIDISIIRALIEAAPVLPEDLGENTGEMVALRCLEELFGPKNGLENVAPPDSRVAFDLSSSCEDVLDHILQEVPFSNLKNGGPELLRWDVLPYIKHKRASLPKCALEQLKDSILEQSPVLDGNENIPTSRFNDSDDENGNQEGNLIPQIHKNDNEALQDGLLERNLLPSKRCRDDLVAGNLGGLVSVKHDGMHNCLHLNGKKFKQDDTPPCTSQSDEQIPIRLHGEEWLEDEPGMIIKVTEIEGKNLGKDSQVGEGDQDGHVASRTLGPSGAVGHLELQDDQMENAQNAGADVMIVEEKVVHGHQSMRKHEHQQEELPAKLKSNDNSNIENTESVPANHVEVEGDDIMKEAVEPQITDPPQKPVNSDGEESSTDANDKFIISNYSIRFRKRETKYSFPPIPQLRRKKVPWTNDEEEMLRKGIEKFANNGGTVPWKRILEFGTKVFRRGRTTVDLKDKWRNMCKGSPRCK